jgi:hypothetical protein
VSDSLWRAECGCRCADGSSGLIRVVRWEEGRGIGCPVGVHDQDRKMQDVDVVVRIKVGWCGVVVVYDCAQSGSRRWSSNHSHMPHGESKIRHQSSKITRRKRGL